MVVDADALQALRDRLDLRRHPAERAAVDGDEEVKGAAYPAAGSLELADGDDVGRALEKAGLAERVWVGGRPRLLAGALEEPDEGDHRAERVAIGAQVPRDKHPFRAGDELRRGRIAFLQFH